MQVLDLLGHLKGEEREREGNSHIAMYLPTCTCWVTRRSTKGMVQCRARVAAHAAAVPASSGARSKRGLTERGCARCWWSVGALKEGVLVVGGRQDRSRWDSIEADDGNDNHLSLKKWQEGQLGNCGQKIRLQVTGKSWTKKGVCGQFENPMTLNVYNCMAIVVKRELWHTITWKAATQPCLKTP
eukprot:1144702-Pelagomonas_calceolata.AAC.2